MKTKFSLFYLWSFIFYLSLIPSPSALSQIPQGFNYQAVAHNRTGAPLANATIQLKMGILSDTLTPVVVWEELHSTVRTNLNGVFTLVIGSGSRQSGSVLSFSEIDWRKSPLYLRTQVFYQNEWKNLGSAQLWSVPYAMSAGDMSGSVKNLTIEGETTSPEEALFEVKNRDGQTIFAVYNEGVRIYVSSESKAIKSGFAVGGFGTDKGESTKYFFVGKDSVRIYLDTDPLTKGRKSGFAVGGYDLSKGSVQKYLDVNPDSVRIYIDNTGKKVKGGFAVGGFDMTKKGTSNFLNIATKADEIIFPSENRIAWYPLKNAFLTGKVIVQSPDSIGENSFSSGYESKAEGGWSQALGYQSVARGNFSTSLGKSSVANGENSFAFGNGALALRQSSFALGRSAQAKGEGSFSLGFNSISSGDDSYAIGTGTEASGQGSFAIGFIGRDSAGLATGNTKATGLFSFALGMGSQATEQGAISFGTLANASGPYSLALGLRPHATGWNSIAIGQGTVSNGEGSIALGRESIANGICSVSLGSGTFSSDFGAVAMGHGAFATGQFSLAVGWGPVASETASVAFGNFTEARAASSFAMGTRTVAGGNESMAMGRYAETKQGAYFAIGDSAIAERGISMGNRTLSSGADAVAIGAFAVASGQNAIAINSRAKGDYSIAIGYGYAKGDGSTAFGNAVTSGIGSYGFGNGIVSRCNNSFYIGQYNDTTVCYSSAAWIDADPLFIVGNGHAPSMRSNALTVFKNGKTAIGNIPEATSTLDVDGSARFRAIPTGTGDQLVADATGNLFRQASDIALKTDIYTLKGALSAVTSLRGVTFNWKNNQDKNHSIGLIAQEVEEVLPEVVFTNPVDGYKGVNYSEIVPVLIEAIKEQQKQIEELRNLVEKISAGSPANDTCHN